MANPHCFHNPSAYAEENKNNDDEILSYAEPPNRGDQHLPMDDPILVAIDALLKKQKHIKTQVSRKEALISKLQQHIIASTVPTDLKFRFEGYKQYPHSIPENLRQEANIKEINIIKEAQQKLLEERITLLSADRDNTKSMLCIEEIDWIHALHAQLPVIRSNARLITRANQLLQAALVSSQLQEQLIAERAAQKPGQVRTPAQAPMSVDAATGNIATLNAKVMALEKQIQSLTIKPNRAKNVSGSGSGSTDRQRNHAAQRRSASQQPRSRSRTRHHFNGREQHPRSHSRNSVASNTTRRAPPRTGQGNYRTSQRERSGTLPAQRRTHSSRSPSRSRVGRSRTPVGNRAEERRRAPFGQRNRRK